MRAALPLWSLFLIFIELALGPAFGISLQRNDKNAAYDIMEEDPTRWLSNAGVMRGGFEPGWPSDTEVKLVSGVKTNNTGDTRTLLLSIYVSTGGFLLTLVISFVLRKYNPVMYNREGKTDIDTSLRGYFDLIIHSRSAAAEEFIEAGGLDAWTLVQFYGLVRRILGTIAPVLIGSLWPLHYYANVDAVVEVSYSDFLSKLDIGNMPAGSNFYWVHAVATVFVVVTATMLMGQAHETFLHHRFLWIEALKPPRATTLLVENIPQQYRSDYALRDYFKGLFGDVIERAYIVRRTSELRAACDVVKAVQYDKALAVALWEFTGKSESQKPNLKEFESKLDHVVAAAEKVRHRVELGAAVGDPEVCAGSGFVTFKSQLWRRLAENEQYRTDSSEFVVQIPPEPSDVIYKDLKKDMGSHLSSEAIGTMCILLVFLFWSPVVVLISGFTTFDNVQERLYFLRTIKERYPGAGTFLEGVFATGVMKLFMCFLPLILFSIITKFFTLKANSWAQLRLERWYVSFLLTFVFLVTIIGRSVLIAVVSLAEDPADLFRLFALSLPGVSHFYMNYLVLDWFSTGIQFIRHGNLLNFWFYRFVRWMKPSVAKSYSEPESPAFFGLGARMGHGVLVATIALVLCTCSPSIILIAWVTMFIGEIVYAYLLFNVETKKADTGGRFWIEVMTQMFLALALYSVLMIGILCRQKLVGPSMLAALSLVVLFRAYERFQNLAWERLPLEAVADKSKRDRGFADDDGSYVQEECVPITKVKAVF